MPKYVIYGTTSCPACTDAKNLLDARMLPYTFHNIQEDEAAFDTYLSFKKRSVPQITFQGELIGGFTDLKEKLNG
ncbi:hypothetical protein LH51_16565 [Nitrincola sp. A-D6]|uniref:glutaredoxin family protein n=1 Tax=Nitrincola sp. A-D6 TaxID=1545442 RepID=UPI00051FC728|nr:hypothetical protein LH51_16565 [Nitrincola sp. A-D6]